MMKKFDTSCTVKNHASKKVMQHLFGVAVVLMMLCLAVTSPATAASNDLAPTLRVLSVDGDMLVSIDGSSISKNDPIIFAVDIPANAEIYTDYNGYTYNLDLVSTPNSFNDISGFLTFSTQVYSDSGHSEYFSWVDATSFKYGDYEVCLEYLNSDGTIGQSNTVSFRIAATSSGGSSSIDYIALSGSGTEIDPYLIQSSSDLKLLSDEVKSGKRYRNAYFAITNNIDLSSYSNWQSIGDIRFDGLYLNDTMSPYWGGVYWDSYYYEKIFCGKVDGRNHIISHMTAESISDYYFDFRGLFGVVGPGAVIKNIILTDVDVCYFDNRYTGGLIGGIYGYEKLGSDAIIIENCHIEGDVYGNGGLIGRAYSEAAPITISKCSAQVSGDMWGGLIGMIDTYSDSADIIISECFVMLQDGVAVEGGFASTLDAVEGSVLVKDCYVSGNDDITTAAGLFSNVRADSASSVTIENCYSDATVSIGYPAGGLIGSMDAVDKYSEIESSISSIPGALTVKNSVYLGNSVTGDTAGKILGAVYREEGSGEITLDKLYAIDDVELTSYSSNEYGYDGFTVSSSDAVTQTFYEDTLGWDFANVWVMNSTVSPYPILQSYFGSPSPVPEPGTGHSCNNITEWQVLSSAPADVTSGTHYYYLTSDIELSSTWNITGEGTDVSLCLNGYNVTFTGKIGSVVNIGEGATFNLYDCLGTGVIRGGKGIGNEYYTYGGGVYNSGTFTMFGGSISECIVGMHGGGVYNIGTFTMFDGNIFDCSSGGYRSGGGVYNIGTFTMFGGSIFDCSANYGGGVYNTDIFTMFGGSISNCISEGKGGGVYNSGIFTLNSGNITYSSTSSNAYNGEGGGIYNSGAFTMSGGSISNCSSENGGGISTSSRSSTINLFSGGIFDCSANYGGGVYISSDSVVNMSGCSIMNCQATGFKSYGGGGVAIYGSGTFNLSGGIISNCSAYYGGGVSISGYNDSSSGVFTISNGNITNCHAYYSGGGVYNAGTTTGFNCNISNSSASYGGGVYNRGEFTISDSSIINCSTYYSGDSVYNRGTFTISGSVDITDVCHVMVLDSSFVSRINEFFTESIIDIRIVDVSHTPITTLGTLVVTGGAPYASQFSLNETLYPGLILVPSGNDLVISAVSPNQSLTDIPGSFSITNPVHGTILTYTEGIDVTWTSSSGAAGYTFSLRDRTISETEDTGKLINNENIGNVLSYTIPSEYLIPGHDYRLAVCAYNDAGEAWEESEFSIATTECLHLNTTKQGITRNGISEDFPMDTGDGTHYWYVNEVCTVCKATIQENSIQYSSHNYNALSMGGICECNYHTITTPLSKTMYATEAVTVYLVPAVESGFKGGSLSDAEEVTVLAEGLGSDGSWSLVKYSVTGTSREKVRFVESVYLSETSDSTNVISINFLPNVGSRDTLEYTVDYGDVFFSEKSTIYNHNLAQVSLGLAAASMGAAGVDYQAYVPTTSSHHRAENIEDAYLKLGFSADSISYYYYDKPLGDNSDKVAYSIAEKEIVLDGEKYCLFVVVPRSGNYGGEWVSNFNIGDGPYAEGFYKPAMEILTTLKGKLDEVPENTDVKIWTTGFSRGAAVSNLLAGFLTKDAENLGLKKENIYAYTFATPQGVDTTYAVNADVHTKYDNIFNIVNPSDLVTTVPMTSWGFDRYGKTYYFDYNKDNTLYSEIVKQYIKLTNQYDTVYIPKDLQVPVVTLDLRLSDTFESKSQYADYHYTYLRDLLSLIFYEADGDVGKLLDIPLNLQLLYPKEDVIVAYYKASSYSNFPSESDLAVFTILLDELSRVVPLFINEITHDNDLLLEILTVIDKFISDSSSDENSDRDSDLDIIQKYEYHVKDSILTIGYLHGKSEETSINEIYNYLNLISCFISLYESDSDVLDIPMQHHQEVYMSWMSSGNNIEDLCSDTNYLYQAIQNSVIDVTVVADGDGIVYGTQRVVPNNEVLILAVPDDGHEFIGWYNDDGDLISTEENCLIEVVSSTTFTAKFQHGYTIEYDLNGGTNDPKNPSRYYVTDADITLNAPSKSFDGKVHYIFDGWTWDEQTKPTKDVVIKSGSRGKKSYKAHWISRAASVNGQVTVPESNDLTIDVPNLGEEYHVEVSEIPTLSPLVGTTGNKPVGLISKYDITTTISPSQVGVATITFSLDKTDLPAGVKPTDIALFHKEAGKWVKLPTTYIRADSDKYWYSAQTTGFSPFAIGYELEDVFAILSPEANQEITTTSPLEVLWSESADAAGYTFTLRDNTLDGDSSSKTLINAVDVGNSLNYVIPSKYLTNGHEYQIIVSAYNSTATVSTESVFSIAIVSQIQEIKNTTETFNAKTAAELSYTLAPENIGTITAPVLAKGGLQLMIDNVVVEKIAGGSSTKVSAEVLANGAVSVSGDISDAESLKVSFIGRMLGDTLGNGKVGAVSALKIAQNIVGLDSGKMSDTDKFYGDVNGDGSIKVVDALMIAQYTVGILDENYVRVA